MDTAEKWNCTDFSNRDCDFVLLYLTVIVLPFVEWCVIVPYWIWTTGVERVNRQPELTVKRLKYVWGAWPILKERSIWMFGMDTWIMLPSIFFTTTFYKNAYAVTPIASNSILGSGADFRSLNNVLYCSIKLFGSGLIWVYKNRTIFLIFIWEPFNADAMITAPCNEIWHSSSHKNVSLVSFACL